MASVIKRSADDIDLDLSGVEKMTWIPSPAVKAEPRALQQQDETPLVVQESEIRRDERQGRFFNLVTIKATSTLTSTVTESVNVGTIAIQISPGEFHCPSGSLGDYVKAC